MNHSNDDWYPDSGMLGPQVRVRNGGLQLNRYIPLDIEVAHQRNDKPGVEFLFRPGLWTEFLRAMDAQWKRGCEEVSK